MFIYSFSFSHLQPGADPRVSCRPVAWRSQLSIKRLGTRVTIWCRACVFFADWPVTLQCHICPRSYGKIKIVQISATVTGPCARLSVEPHIEYGCTYVYYTWDLCVIGKCYKYTIIYNDTLINLISHTFFKTKLNQNETVEFFYYFRF